MRGTAGNSSSTKQCIVLGEYHSLSTISLERDRNSFNSSTSEHSLCVVGSPRSGKSTLVKRISSITGELSPTHDQDGETLDLGMSYSVLDVKDESPASTAGTASGEEGKLKKSIVPLSDSISF